MSIRLITAIEDGAIVVPRNGPIAVFRPTAAIDLSPLDPARLHVIQGHKPDFDAFTAAGYDTRVDPDGRYVAALVCLPKSKEQARGLIAQAAQMTDGPIWIDGQKTDGVESILREIRKRTDVFGVTSKAHGKLFGVHPSDFSDWAAKPQTVDTFQTAPGVFSADKIDAGSAMLVNALPEKPPARVADLGAGWGYLSRAILQRESVKELHLVEAEHIALQCARQNITDPRAQFHWANALTFKPEKPLEAVIMNPPFHQGRSTEASLGQGFITAAARILAPHGKL